MATQFDRYVIAHTEHTSIHEAREAFKVIIQQKELQRVIEASREWYRQQCANDDARRAKQRKAQGRASRDRVAKHMQDRRHKRQVRHQAIQRKYDNLPTVDQLLDEYKDEAVTYFTRDEWVEGMSDYDIDLYYEYQQFLIEHRYDTGLLERFASTFDDYVTNRWRFG